MMRVYVHIIAWNEREYLPALLEDLRAQTYPHITLRVLDNGSTDGTGEYLQEHEPLYLVARNKKNLGFAEGHNQLVRFTLHYADPQEPAGILFMNADMLIEPNAIECIVQAYERTGAIIQPKVYRAFGENVGDEYLQETMKSDLIDTTGLDVARNWRMSDRGAGEMDKGQYDTEHHIFGPAGACFFLPLEVARESMLEDDLFDKTFFAYREDCDLAWRLQKLGFDTYFEPSSIVYHYRGMYGAQKQSWRERLTNRKGQNPFFAALSTRNQCFVLLKNLTVMDAILRFPALVISEGSRVLYGLFFEPQTRKRLFGSVTLIPNMWRKRRMIAHTQRRPEAEIRTYAK